MHALLGAAMVVLALQGAVETIARDSSSNIDTATQAVARTPQEWQALWRRHAGDRPAPKVDLGTRMVVAVFLGSRSTGGYRAEVTGTKQEGGTLIVEWREQRPDPRDIVAQVITSPAHLASIAKFDGEVVFRKADK